MAFIEQHSVNDSSQMTPLYMVLSRMCSLRFYGTILAFHHSSLSLSSLLVNCLHPVKLHKTASSLHEALRYFLCKFFLDNKTSTRVSPGLKCSKCCVYDTLAE